MGGLLETTRGMGNVVVDIVVFITLTDQAPTIFTNRKKKKTLHAVANPVRGLLDREEN